MNKQVYSSILGIIIVVTHIFLLYYLWFIFRPRFPGPIAPEIATPLTAAFFIGVIKWVIDTQGKITSNDKVGITFIIITSIVSLSLLGALVFLPFIYSDSEMTKDDLNSYFLFVETGLGGAFTLLFNDMFGQTTSDTSS